MSQIEIKIVPPPAINVDLLPGFGVGSGTGGGAPIATNTIAGNNTGATAAPIGLTPAQSRTLLGVLSDAELMAILASYQKNFNLTNGDGDVNKFQVRDNVGETGFASFEFWSEYVSEGFGVLQVNANAEEGFGVGHGGSILTVNESVAAFTGGSGHTVGVNPTGYQISHPSAFRSTIGAIANADLQAALEDFVSAVYARTTDPGTAGTPWNNGGVWTFSAGSASPSLNFSVSTNSQYIGSLN